MDEPELDDGGWYVESGVILEGLVSLKSEKIGRLAEDGVELLSRAVYLKNGIQDLLGGRYGRGRPRILDLETDALFC